MSYKRRMLISMYFYFKLVRLLLSGTYNNIFDRMDESFLLEQLLKSMDSMNSMNTSTDSASRLPPRKEDMNELLTHLENQVCQKYHVFK